MQNQGYYVIIWRLNWLYTRFLCLYRSRSLLLQVKNFTFYDVVLDFILMDAFDDLENPPSSVIAVVNNRWLSNGFKETVSFEPHHKKTCLRGLRLVKTITSLLSL